MNEPWIVDIYRADGLQIGRTTSPSEECAQVICEIAHAVGHIVFAYPKSEA